MNDDTTEHAACESNPQGTPRTTRRNFCQKAAATSACLLLPGLNGMWRTGDAAERPAGTFSGVELRHNSAKDARNAPILVVTQTVSRDVNPRASAWGYITEILQRAGLFFEQQSADSLTSALRPSNRIVLLAGDLQLTSAQRDLLGQTVRNGGSLIGIGGTSGLDQVFGASGGRSLAEGWIQVTAQDHPVTAALRSSLHVFGGFAVQAGSANSLANLESGNQGVKGSAILENRFGKGRAILLAPDLIFSIVHIQQGVPVFQDARPAPDGSAITNDGELKAEDGLVLDWDRDRTPMQPDGVPVFLEPITDDLREIILRSLFHVASQQGVPLPVLWYWPRGLKAVGHLSHDTDGNDPKKAPAMLEVVNRCHVKSTWCTLYPGGYPKEFYGELKAQGFEIALHYDARSRGEHTSWSKANFLFQHRWLLKEAGLEHISSNKNHYTRWESRLDFLRWCEEVGIHGDQTRGPSKQGTIGFPLGGSQPYFPLDDEADVPRRLDVLEVNMLTQDLVVVCPAEYGKQLMDSVLRHHGVAHFLFHPAHILKAGVADALGGLIEYGRTQGVEWWTHEDIYRWEKLRRSVQAQFEQSEAGAGVNCVLRAAKPVREATLLFLKSQQKPRSLSIDGQPAQCEPCDWLGFAFDRVTLDVSGDVEVRTA